MFVHIIIYITSSCDLNPPAYLYRIINIIIYIHILYTPAHRNVYMHLIQRRVLYSLYPSYTLCMYELNVWDELFFSFFLFLFPFSLSFLFFFFLIAYIYGRYIRARYALVLYFIIWYLQWEFPFAHSERTWLTDGQQARYYTESRVGRYEDMKKVGNYVYQSGCRTQWTVATSYHVVSTWVVGTYLGRRSSRASDSTSPPYLPYRYRPTSCIYLFMHK